MKKDQITEFRLFKKDLREHNHDSRYTFKTIGVEDFANNLDDIKKVISYHHEDLEWDDTPTTKVVYDRLEFGSQCHLWMYEDKCLGWHWTNPKCVTIDWKSYHQSIKENEIYIGGALLSRKFKLYSDSSWFFYRQGFEYSFDLTNTDTMYLYSDNWNRASAMLCYKSGFTKYNFINETN